MITQDFSIGVEDLAPVGKTMRALYFPPIGDARSGAAAPFTLCVNGVPIVDKMLESEPALLERDAGTALLIRLADAIARPLLGTGMPKRVAQAMALDAACMLASRDVLDVPDRVRPANSRPHEQFINVVTSDERVTFEMTTAFRSSAPTTDAAVADPREPDPTAKPVTLGDTRSNSLDGAAATSFIDPNEPARRAPEAGAGGATGMMVVDPSEPDPTAKLIEFSDTRSNSSDETAATSFIDPNEPAPRSPEASAGGATGKMVVDASEPDPTAKLTELSDTRSNSLDETAATSFIDPNEPAQCAPEASAGGVKVMMLVRRTVSFALEYDRERHLGKVSAGCGDVRVLLDKRLGAKLVHEETVRLGAPGNAWIPEWLGKFLEGIADYFRVKRIAFAFTPDAPTWAPDAAPPAAHMHSADLTEFARNATCFSAHQRGDWVHQPTHYDLRSDTEVARNATLPNTPSLSALRDGDAQARLKRFEASGLAAVGAHYRGLTQSLAKDRTVTYQGSTLAKHVYPDGPWLLGWAGVQAKRDVQAAREARAALENRVFHAFIEQERPFVWVDGKDAMPYEADDVRNAGDYLAMLRRIKHQTKVAELARETFHAAEKSFILFGTSLDTLWDAAAHEQALLDDCETALLGFERALKIPAGSTEEERLALVKSKLLDALLEQIRLKVGHTDGLYERLLRLMQHGPDVTRTLIAHDGPRFPERDTEQLTIHIDTRASENFPDISVEPGTVAVTIASGCAALKPGETVAFGSQKLEASTVDASTKFEAYWLVSPKAGAKLDLVKYDATFALRQQEKSTANVSKAQRAGSVEKAAVSQTTVPSELAAPPAALKRRDPRSKTLPPHELGVGPRFVAELRAAAQANVKTEDQARADLAAYVYDRFEQGLPVVELNGGDALADEAGDDVTRVRDYIDALRALQHQILRTKEALGKTGWTWLRDVGHFFVEAVDSGDDVVREYLAEKVELDKCQAEFNRCLEALNLPLDLSHKQQSAQVKERLLNALLERIDRELRMTEGLGATDGARAQISALLLYGAGATHELIYGNDDSRLPDPSTGQIVFNIFTKENDKFPGIRVNPGKVVVTLDSAGMTPAERGTGKPDGEASGEKARPDPSRSFTADWLVSSTDGLELANVHYDERFKRSPRSESEAQSRVHQASAAVAEKSTREERIKRLKDFESLGGVSGDEDHRALMARIETDGYAALNDDQVSPSTYVYGPMFVEEAGATAKQSGTKGVALGAEAAVLAKTLWLQCLQPESDAFLLLNGKNPLAGNDDRTKTLLKYAQALDTLARERATKGAAKGAKPPESKATKEKAEQAKAAEKTRLECAAIYQVQGQSLDKQIETVKAHLYEKLVAYIRDEFPDTDVQQRIVQVLCHGRYAMGKVIQGNGGPLFEPTHARPDRITIDTSPDAQAGAADNVTIKFHAHDERQHGDAPVIIGNGKLDSRTAATHTSLSTWRVSKQETELVHLESRLQCMGGEVLDLRNWRERPVNALDLKARAALSKRGRPIAKAKYEALLRGETVRWDERWGLDAEFLERGTKYLQVAGPLDALDEKRRTKLRRTLGRQLLLSCARNEPFLRLNDVDLLAGRKKYLAAYHAKRQPGRNATEYNAVKFLAKSFELHKKPDLWELPMNDLVAEVETRLVDEALAAIRQAFPDKRTCELVIAAVVNGSDAMHCIIREAGSLDWSDPHSEHRSIRICTRPNDDLVKPVLGAQPEKVGVEVPEGHVVVEIKEASLPLGPTGTVRVGGKGAAAVFAKQHLKTVKLMSTVHIHIQDDQMAVGHGRFLGKLELTRASADKLAPPLTLEQASALVFKK
ncbi:hypothetical protein MB84_27795 (plasmid) [Pandoraea oxalativorans]|uniref:Uncharacterized protein n=2 Tax=Pandoraea oxalativorans TaxID=573737 RepID=A0A0G3IBS2_9BURK|nr:hypothetical protein MB84_27795 [Pandoraea oxalativorans]